MNAHERDALGKRIESMIATLNADLIQAIDVFHFCDGDDWREWKDHLAPNSRADQLIRKIVLWDRYCQKQQERRAISLANPSLVEVRSERPKLRLVEAPQDHQPAEPSSELL